MAAPAAGVVAMRAFVPARDFAESRRFYEALGFEMTPIGDKLAQARLGRAPGVTAFLLQDYYQQDFAENCMMHLLVEELDPWWDHIAGLDLAGRFSVRPPQPPRLEPWGLRVAYVWDPAGVLWHIAA